MPDSHRSSALDLLTSLNAVRQVRVTTADIWGWGAAASWMTDLQLQRHAAYLRLVTTVCVSPTSGLNSPVVRPCVSHFVSSRVSFWRCSDVPDVETKYPVFPNRV